MAKAQQNLVSHGVTFEEAASAFDDPLALSNEDDPHSANERRFILTGQSALARVLPIAYTMRRDSTRIMEQRVLVLQGHGARLRRAAKAVYLALAAEDSARSVVPAGSLESLRRA